jgi:hypothetical protein
MARRASPTEGVIRFFLTAPLADAEATLLAARAVVANRRPATGPRPRRRHTAPDGQEAAAPPSVAATPADAPSPPSPLAPPASRLRRRRMAPPAPPPPSAPSSSRRRGRPPVQPPLSESGPFGEVVDD